MLGSEDSSSSSDELDQMDPDDTDDPMMMTPQVNKTSSLFPGAVVGNSPFANLFSPGGIPNFMSIQRARLRKGRSRKSSSSASGHSSMASPGPGSPPNNKGEGYFAREAVRKRQGSRRESLSLFTNDLHISSGNDSGDEATALPQTPGVVRRVVTRRGTLLVSVASCSEETVANCCSPNRDSLVVSELSCLRKQLQSIARHVVKLRSFDKCERMT